MQGVKHVLKVTISWDSYTPDCLVGFLGVPIVYDSFEQACKVATILFDRTIDWIKTDDSCNSKPILDTEINCKRSADSDVEYGIDKYIDPLKFYKSSSHIRLVYWLCDVLDHTGTVAAWFKIEIEKMEANKDVNY